MWKREARKWSWTAAAAAVVAVLLTGSVQSRAFAQKLLGLFRVSNVVVVSVDRSAFSEGKGKLLGQMLSENVAVSRDEKPQMAASREKASELAGFPVRLPAARPDQPRLTVEGARAFHLSVDQRRIAALLEIAGRPDLRLPDALNGASVAVSIPRGVVAAWGDCAQRRGDELTPEAWTNCISLAQFPAPTVITLPAIDIAPVAEVALQLAGMSQPDARAFSRAVDWTSTLVLPLPRDIASHEEAEVDGVRGVLIQHRPFRSRPARYGLVWAKNGMIYSLNGYGNPSYAVPLANSLE